MASSTATQTPTNQSGAPHSPALGTGQGIATPRPETKNESPMLMTFSIFGAPTSRMAYQSTTWTSSGVLRKISTKSIARRATSQFVDRRATPTMTPRIVASRIATNTARSVAQTPTRYIVMREFVTPSTSISHWLPTAKPAGSLRKVKPKSRRSSAAST